MESHPAGVGEASAREAEGRDLTPCAAVAQGRESTARDGREANLWRVAAMVIHSRSPEASARLMQASEGYFARHPHERLAVAEVLRRGWSSALPRLRDLLSRQLQIR